MSDNAPGDFISLGSVSFPDFALMPPQRQVVDGGGKLLCYAPSALLGVYPVWRRTFELLAAHGVLALPDVPIFAEAKHE